MKVGETVSEFESVSYISFFSIQINVYGPSGKHEYESR